MSHIPQKLIPNQESERVSMIRQLLQVAFLPTLLEITDNSQQHAGHASAGGAGHFAVRIRASAFAGKTPLQCHRQIYAALDCLMGSEIHALTIDAAAI
ncbi:MAG: BolA family transcriptional regulator [Gammaproteobacteria bacterium]|nr:BolA family transcriptional regulator [Gammaproteobacteria bacterium]